MVDRTNKCYTPDWQRWGWAEWHLCRPQSRAPPEVCRLWPPLRRWWWSRRRTGPGSHSLFHLKRQSRAMSIRGLTEIWGCLKQTVAATDTCSCLLWYYMCFTIKFLNCIFTAFLLTWTKACIHSNLHYRFNTKLDNGIVLLHCFLSLFIIFQETDWKKKNSILAWKEQSIAFLVIQFRNKLSSVCFGFTLYKVSQCLEKQ